MICRLFVANRGEIALRVLRTAHRLGMTTILGASEADRQSVPALLADEVMVIGPGPSSESYLSVDKVVAAATEAKADAVHPGYGFLSENARFAEAVRAAGMIFVGPSADSLNAMGDKLTARAVAIEAGLPVVPGGPAANKAEARQRAEETGYPLLLKAVSGGGGRGMKRVDRAQDLDGQIDIAMAEAQAAFGDGRIYVERFIASGRHVEVQVLADGVRAIHLGERDCSIQRRFQKLVEEAPAPGLPDAVRAGLHTAAVHLAHHLGYAGAGTVEFLLDTDTMEFHFLEMNARIQVEHPVTEAITGVDLVEQQLLIADGQPLSLVQEGVTFHGHAIEVRVNAEDPAADFRPSPGVVTAARWPAGPGVRVDSHMARGQWVPPYYDSLLGKVIVWGIDRAAALGRLQTALAATEIEGVATTVGLHRTIAAHPTFHKGGVDTRFFQELSNG